MTLPAGDFWDYLRRATPARIALGRAGDGLPTRRVHEFELAHARARDAVKANLDPAVVIAELAHWRPILVRSEAKDRATFLQRPDLGRRLARDFARALSPGRYDATIIIADGLSACAIQVQAAPAATKFRVCPSCSGASGARRFGRRDRGEARGGPCRRAHRRASRPLLP